MIIIRALVLNKLPINVFVDRKGKETIRKISGSVDLNDMKQCRLRLSLSIADMARALGVHRQTYVKWERGEQKPPAVAIRLVKTLLWLHDIGMFSDYLESLSA